MTANEPRGPRLRPLQHWMAERIAQPVPSAAAEAEAHALFAAPSRAAALERLGVHQAGYPARLEEALRETYPAVAHLVGARVFCSLVSRYLPVVPRFSYDLGHAGRNLAAFLRRDALGAELPFLVDLAQLEWRVAHAFHAFEETPLDATAVEAVRLEDWGRLALRFQPAVSVVCSEWPVATLWRARVTPLEKVDIDLVDRPERVLVRRSGYDVACDLVGESEAAALRSLLAGRPLADVAAELDAAGSEATDVSGWFARWMALGLVAECVPSSARPGSEIRPG